MTVFLGASDDSPLRFPGQHCALQGPHVGVSCADPSQVSRHGMAGGAFSRPVEVGFAGLRIAHQWIHRAGRCGAATDRHAVNKGRDGRDLFCREIKLWHALIRPAVLNNRSDQFAIVIVQHQLTADQIGAPFATASIGSMAKTAIRAKNLVAARNHGRVGRRPHRISRRTGHANRRGAGGCAGAWGVACLAPGSWAGAGTEDCSATRAAAPSPSNVKRTIFTRCKMTSRLRLRPAILNFSHYLTVEKTRGPSFEGNPYSMMRTRTSYASTGSSAMEKDFRSIAGRRRARVVARRAMKASMAHHKP